MTNSAVHSDTTALIVNGEERFVPAGTTLGELLRSLALDPRMVVVEHNRTILRERAAYDTLVLAQGDTLEIVHFVGGG
jgi:thiamine biosynthesis protein ThiS